MTLLDLYLDKSAHTPSIAQPSMVMLVEDKYYLRTEPASPIVYIAKGCGLVELKDKRRIVVARESAVITQ